MWCVFGQGLPENVELHTWHCEALWKKNDFDRTNKRSSEIQSALVYMYGSSLLLINNKALITSQLWLVAIITKGDIKKNMNKF